MPSKSAVLRDPAALHERRSDLVTSHKRNPGTRAADKERQRDLLAGHALIASGALPQDGGQKLHVEKPNLSEIALRMGKAAPETACRLLNRPGNSLIAGVRTKAGKSYAWKISEKADRTYKENFFNPASAAELAQDKKFKGLFPEKCSERNFAKFVEAVYDERCPLTSSEREVLSYLFARGLFIQDASGRWKSGRVKGNNPDHSPTQEEIAAELGKHRTTVARALHSMAEEWTDKAGVVHHGRGIFKIIRKPGRYMKNGVCVAKDTPSAEWIREEPDEYIGICDWALTERERYEHAMQAIRATQGEWAKVMDQIYADVFKRWQEENKQQKTFIPECRRQMTDAGVPAHMIEIAVPSPPG